MLIECTFFYLAANSMALVLNSNFSLWLYFVEMTWTNLIIFFSSIFHNLLHFCFYRLSFDSDDQPSPASSRSASASPPPSRNRFSSPTCRRGSRHSSPLVVNGGSKSHPPPSKDGIEAFPSNIGPESGEINETDASRGQQSTVESSECNSVRRSSRALTAIVTAASRSSSACSSRSSAPSIRADTPKISSRF